MIKLSFPKFNRLVVVLLVLFLPPTLFAQKTIQKPAAPSAAATLRILQPGQKIESKIAAGETQEFGVALAENEFARVAYEKLFNQLDVGVYDPQGEPVAQVGFSQLKSIVFAARRAGEYRVRIKASLKPGDAATYFITLAEKRPAKTGDENLIKAQTLFAEAAEITRQASLESRETGIIKYKEAAEIWLAANQREAAGAAFNSLGVIQFQLSRFSDALKSYEQAGRLFKPGTFEQAIALGNSGAAQLNFGNLQKAVDAYNEALPAIKAEKNYSIEALFLNNIGKIYERADSPRAMEFYEQALAAALKTNDARAEATIRVNTGGRLVDLQQYERAAAFFKRGIEIYESVKEPLAAAASYRALGSLYLKSGNLEKAAENLEKALSLYRAGGERIGEVNTLRLLGALSAERGDIAAALENLNQALSLARALEIRQSEALILHNTARLYLRTNRLPEALKACEAALAIVEDLRLNLVNQSLREASSASLRQYYELYIHVLQKLGEESGGGAASEDYAARSLEASDRARARSLLQLLAETRADIRAGVDAKLLERERELAVLLKTKSEQQSRLLSRGANAEQKAAIAAELSQLSDEYENVRSRIRRQSPSYAALTQPKPLTAKEIRALLDKDTILLEYALGEAGSFVWLVTPESVSTYKLPEREKIEAAARRYYELISARSERPAASENALQKEARLKTADRQAAEASRALGEILFGRIKEKIGGKKRIVVVAEGALQYVPFAALSISEANSPLVAEHEIINLPSASTLAVLRETTANRPAAGQTIAVFADPVFSPSDPRVTAGRQRQQAKNRQPGKQTTAQSSDNSLALDEPALRAFEEVSESEAASETGAAAIIPRLPFSRREAEAVLRLAPSGAALKAVDFDASLAAVTGKNLAEYKIVHFATHGFLNSKNPELSGLVLSLVDRGGKETDGFLRLGDIYNLRLTATELVVLSACRTALVKYISGEVLIGLARGFMYAGSPRVVASLWKVDDAATAELMKRFYDYLLNRKLRPAEALRAAQIEMSQSERYGAPYFWAAFTLQGEWK